MFPSGKRSTIRGDHDPVYLDNLLLPYHLTGSRPLSLFSLSLSRADGTRAPLATRAVRKELRHADTLAFERVSDPITVRAESTGHSRSLPPPRALSKVLLDFIRYTL